MALKYFHRIMSFYDFHQVGKGFSLAPIVQIKSHHLSIDSTVLYEMLKNVYNTLGPSAPEWMSPLASLTCKTMMSSSFKDEMWRKTFELTGLRRNRRFNNQVDTDGVTMSVHFVFTKKSRTRNRKRRCHKYRFRTSRVVSIIQDVPIWSLLMTPTTGLTRR